MKRCYCCGGPQHLPRSCRSAVGEEKRAAYERGYKRGKSEGMLTAYQGAAAILKRQSWSHTSENAEDQAVGTALLLAAGRMKARADVFVDKHKCLGGLETVVHGDNRPKHEEKDQEFRWGYGYCVVEKKDKGDQSMKKCDHDFEAFQRAKLAERLAACSYSDEDHLARMFPQWFGQGSSPEDRVPADKLGSLIALIDRIHDLRKD